MLNEKLPPIPGEVNNPPLRFDRDAMVEAEKALKEAGRQVLGKGAESLVEIHPLNPDVVVAHSFRKEFRAEETLQTHKVLKILFPKNFPAIYSAFENTDESRGGTVRERVRDTGRMLAKPKSAFFGKPPKDARTFEYVNEELQSMGIEGLHFDGETDRNFLVSEEGYQQYLDTAPFLARELIRCKEGVLDYMNRRSYTEKDRQDVQAAISALETLIATRAY